MNEPRPVGHPRPPSVDQVLRSVDGAAAAKRFGHQATVSAIRHVLGQRRKSGRRDGLITIQDATAVAVAASRLLEKEAVPSVRRVFNLTGTVLHTNLGRAILPEVAIDAAVEAMRHAIALEFDVATGERGERDDHVRGLIRELTGADDACLVNNNAGAVLLVLNTFGSGKEAIVSRGELIEIGGAFRLPDIMARAGARLIEVGTTNRTHLKDYEQAVRPDTGLILKAHTSNYLIQGFTKSVSAPQLSRLARARGIPFVHDLGSGALVDLERCGLKREPTVRECLTEGADLVTFSGDKLLGGPQVGLIAGAKDLVAQVARNPMKRALRLDKIRLAALEAVLKLYRDPDRLSQTLTTLAYLTRPQAEIAAAASRIQGAVSSAVGADYDVTVTDCASQIGSGSLPLETLPSCGIAIKPSERRGAGRRLEAVATAFRALPFPVIGYVRDGGLMLDLRCLDDEPTFLGQLDLLRKHLGAGGRPDAAP